MQSHNQTIQQPDNLYDLTVLLRDGYSSLEHLCRNAEQHIPRLKEHLSFDYIRHCVYIIDELKSFLQQRSGIFIPYLLELHEKYSSNHNCASCSGRCHVQHGTTLAEQQISLERLKSTLEYIYTELRVIYSRTSPDEDFVWMNREMDMLFNLIRELLYLEGEKLVPEIKKAQTHINAHR